MTRFFRQLREEFFFPVNEENLRVRADQLRARLQMYPTMMGGQALLSMLFVWMMWDAVPHAALLAWIAAAYALYAADMLGWLLNRHKLYTVQECRRWHIAFTLFTLAGGLVWGSTALWMFPLDAEHQALLVMVILGLSAASVTTNPSYPSSFYIYALSVALPLVFRFALGDSRGHWVMACILLLYLAVVLSAGRDLGKAFRAALRQRHENDALVEQLTRQKAYSENLRQQAEMASSEKSRFLAAASHDLRQPLQALTLFSEALSVRAQDPDVRQLALQIEKSVHALGDMFNELLDLSRLDAGMLTPNRQHFALQPLLDRLYVDFAPLAQAKGLACEIPASSKQPDEDAVIYSDPFLLERVLRNLLSNAIRYTEQGKVALRWNRTAAALKFEVADTGIGIRADIIPHIFEEYYQADNPNRDRRKGLGLGLAIVRRIEPLLGCKVEVSSEPGRGSVFGFSVPLGDAGQLAHPFTITHSRHDLNGTVVALVEDDPDIRRMTAELMTQWGCRVVAGELPGDAMREMDLLGLRPALLVCDYRLPRGMTAVHAIREMRQQWGGGLPAMVLTGDTAPEVLHEIRECDAMLLHKPVTPARLRSLMHLALHGG
ncbi:MAG TPA: hybrid sensor histidine kinase/response regulator [Gallionellaceae bacterium]